MSGLSSDATTEDFDDVEGRLVDGKGGRYRKETEKHYVKSESRSNRIHVDNLLNNEDKQRERQIKMNTHK